MLIGVLGLYLFLGNGDSATPGKVAATTGSPTPTATRASASPSASPSVSATPSPSPSPTDTPSPTPTATPLRQQSGSTAGGGSAPPPPTPTPEPAPAPAAAGGPYCNTISSTAPPNAVIGTLTIGGAPAPAGTVVSLAFDGVIGPNNQTRAAGGYRVDYAAGGADCANRVGAAITVIVNGQAFPTGVAVGEAQNPLIFAIDVP